LRFAVFVGLQSASMAWSPGLRHKKAEVPGSDFGFYSSGATDLLQAQPLANFGMVGQLNSGGGFVFIEGGEEGTLAQFGDHFGVLRRIFARRSRWFERCWGGDWNSRHYEFLLMEV